MASTTATATKRKPSICLLLCDTPAPEVVAQYGDYHRIFHTLLAASAPRTDANGPNFDFDLESFDVVHKMEYPDEARLSKYHGIMMTGSAASAYEDKEWINRLVAWVKHVVEIRPYIKIIGICFGHQVVARALGGECIPNGGKWEIGPTTLDLTPLGKQILGVPELNIQQFHRDHVPTLPPSFHLLGSTSVSSVQGMVKFADPITTAASPHSPRDGIDDIHVFCVQGHPEFTSGIVETVCSIRAKSGILTEEIVKDVERRLGWRNDGVLIGRVIWRILGVA